MSPQSVQTHTIKVTSRLKPTKDGSLMKSSKTHLRAPETQQQPSGAAVTEATWTDELKDPGSESMFGHIRFSSPFFGKCAVFHVLQDRLKFNPLNVSCVLT